MDLDLRKIRYFMAVAEHLNFGLAARSLHIAQPVLSRQIRALEDELKVQLFVRDKRGTTLTPAGEQLREDAATLLVDADALRRRVERVACGPRTFTVAFMPGLTVSSAMRAFAETHPDLSIEVLLTSWDDQAEVLRDGRADVSYLRLPADRAGLSSTPLFTEPRGAVLPAHHRLADKQEIHLADLADDTLLQPRPGTRMAHTARHRPRPRAPTAGLRRLPPPRRRHVHRGRNRRARRPLRRRSTALLNSRQTATPTTRQDHDLTSSPPGEVLQCRPSSDSVDPVSTHTATDEGKRCEH